MIKFTSIEAKNWRNFGNIRVKLTDRMFFIGANASGKSNFLDIFRFLKDVANDGLLKAVESRGGIKKLRSLHARQPSYIEIHVCLREQKDSDSANEWEYILQFNAAGGKKDRRDVNISLEKVVKNGAALVERRYNSENEDYISKQYTTLEQPASNREYRALFEAFKNISYVNIIPQLIRESDSINMVEDFYGRNLLERIAETPVKTRTARLNKISKVLQKTVPQFSDLSYVKDEKGHPHLQVRYEHFRPAGAYQLEDQFSDGTLRLFGIIWAILDGEGLMLLEEPELYLHSEIVSQLPMFIAHAQDLKDGRKRQIFISSHSRDLLGTNTISAEEIAILNQEKEDTSVRIAGEVQEIKDMIDAGFTPADAAIPHTIPKGIIEGQLSLFDLY